jgi:prepilin-type N-terminal cleavage/methylation domain-containing protein
MRAWRQAVGACAAGFTLLEVAVAMAIAGIGVTTVLQLFSAGLRVETMSSTRARAVLYARAVLDQVTSITEFEAGSGRGDFENGYRYEWSVRKATEYTDEDTRDLDVKTGITMYEIEVSVLWPRSADRDGVYTLRTLRVASQPPI